ncbi:MAG: YggS family pyridoxal phosphate-dependent enzyme [Syntrophomonadaceae bacterium]|nr:YggS family pyridoxal phosphate-dependent enzyme [Syntrophomonadaceae bacterium]
MTKIDENITWVRDRISQAALRVRRDPEAIGLIAVSKTAGLDAVAAAVRCGISDFGENRVQDLISKSGVYPEVNWHMIGRLQTNKVKEVIGRTALIHSLDRWALAEYIEKRAVLAGITVPVLVQVNVSGEESKAGISGSQVEEFLDDLSQFNQVQVKGLMTIAPEVDNPEETRPVFRELNRLFKQIGKKDYPRVKMNILSMGMTQDFEIAIEEGANLVRIGSAIFASGR